MSRTLRFHVRFIPTPVTLGWSFAHAVAGTIQTSPKGYHRMDSSHKRFRMVLTVLSLAVMLVVATTAWEYWYSKHFFTVNYWWYLLRTRFLYWTDLHFAFLVDFGKTESTVALAGLLGVSGWFTWRCVSSGNIARGVGLSMIGIIVLCFASSVCMLRQATLIELLALTSVQMIVVFVTSICLRWSEPLRFNTRDLLALPLLAALYLVALQVAGQFGNQTPTFFRPRFFVSGGTVNAFQLLLGLVAGLVSAAFLLRSRIPAEFRAAYVIAMTFVAAVAGGCVALTFELLPTMQAPYGNLSAVDFAQIHFRAGYIALFPLTGVMTVAVGPVVAWLLRVVGSRWNAFTRNPLASSSERGEVDPA